MKRETALELLRKLKEQAKDGFKAIKSLENSGEFGYSHTIMREQINSTLNIIEYLKENQPYPFELIDFSNYLGDALDGQPRPSWLGWL